MRPIPEYKKEAKRIRVKKIWRIISLIVILVSVSISGFLGYRVLLYSDYFTIKQIQVSGLHLQSKKELLSIVQKYKGQPILSLPLNVIKSKIEELPRIQSVVIKRHWPDRIDLNVQERTAVALLNIHHAKFFHLMSVDMEGYLLADGKNIVNMDLPIITYKKMKLLFPGDQIKNSEILNVLSVLNELKERHLKLYELVNEINLRKVYQHLHYKVWMTDKNFPVKTDEFDLFLFQKIDAVLSLYRKYDEIQSFISFGSNLVLRKKI